MEGLSTLHTPFSSLQGGFGTHHRDFVRNGSDHPQHPHQTAVFLVREDDGAADLRLVVLGTALDVVNDMERGEYFLRSELLAG